MWNAFRQSKRICSFDRNPAFNRRTLNYSMASEAVSIISVESLPSGIVTKLPELYRAYSGYASREQLRTLAIRRLRALVSKPECFLIAARQRGAIRGLACWRFLTGESRISGFSRAQVEMIIAEGDYVESRDVLVQLINRILASFRENQVAHVTIRLNAEEVPTIVVLKEWGFEAIKRESTLWLRPQSPGPLPCEGDYEVRAFSEENFDEILRIAQSRFAEDCFHADPVLSTEMVGRLSQAFAFDRCTVADTVLVTLEKGRIVAYATCKTDSELPGILRGIIDSCAVAEECRTTQEVSGFMQRAAIAWLSQRNVQIAETCFDASGLAGTSSPEESAFKVIGNQLVLRRILTQ